MATTDRETKSRVNTVVVLLFVGLTVVLLVAQFVSSLLELLA